MILYCVLHFSSTLPEKFTNLPIPDGLVARERCSSNCFWGKLACSSCSIWELRAAQIPVSRGFDYCRMCQWNNFENRSAFSRLTGWLKAQWHSFWLSCLCAEWHQNLFVAQHKIFSLLPGAPALNLLPSPASPQTCWIRPCAPDIF